MTSEDEISLGGLVLDADSVLLYLGWTFEVDIIGITFISLLRHQPHFAMNYFGYLVV